MSSEITPKLRIQAGWFVGIGAAFLLFVVVGAYSLHMNRVYPTYDRQRAADRYVTLAKVREAQSKLLTNAAWVDQAKGTVIIPIDEAMTRELETLQAKPVRMGDVIPGSVPAPATAPASTNAAPAAPAAQPATPPPAQPKK